MPTLSKLFEKLLLKQLLPIIENTHLIPDFQFGFRRKHSTIKQVHAVVKKSSNALENKQFCCGLFLDVAQAFDKVWHAGLIHKIHGVLPKAYCSLIESYLKDRTFQVSYNGALSNWCSIQAGVLQGSVLEPILYLLYMSDIPTSDQVDNPMFADDTALLAVADDQEQGIEMVQQHMNKLLKWTNRWKIKINSDKSKHVVFSLRYQKDLPLHVGQSVVTKSRSVKYLGLNIDEKAKCNEIRAKLTSKYYWLIGRNSILSLENKRLMYLAILKPIWLYGITLWGAASQSNVRNSPKYYTSVIHTFPH